MATKITRDVMEGYLNCRLKGYLTFRSENGNSSEYQGLVDQSSQDLRRAAEDLVKARFPAAHDAKGTTLERQLLMRGPALILDALIENDLLSVRVDGLKRISGPSDLGEFHYIPILFGEGGKARQSQKRALEIYGLVLGDIQGRQPGRGILVDSEKSSFVGVRLNADTRATRTLLRGLREIRDADAVPEPILNNHCPACRFQQPCQTRSLATDNLSLLRGIGEEGIAKLARRGIFTVTQLSYTFRPRRSGKNLPGIRTHSFALQALAIRENKTYVLGNPKLPETPMSVHFDIEGSAERGTAYLIGMIVEDGVSERRFSFWADRDDEQEKILRAFLDVVESYPAGHLFCYGSFEIAFLKRMRKPGWAERIDGVLTRTTNILSIIYSSVYFPVYSNGLKQIGAHLGCRWSAPEASGLQCIVWRRRWEESRDEDLRRTIETYNLEDCAALGKIVQFLHSIAAGDPIGNRRWDHGAMPGFTRAEAFPVPYSRREWCKTIFAIPDFDHINNLARFDYQRERVFIRSSNCLRRARVRERKNKRRKRHRIAEWIEIECQACPTCQSTRLASWADARQSRVVMDLKIAAGGIHRRFVRVTSPRYRCRKCGAIFAPHEYTRVDRHSHSVKSWAMYEHVAHRVSLEKLSESFRECFGLHITFNEIHGFKYLMAQYYAETIERLQAKLLAGRVIHADETEVNLRGVGKAYVWVFTNLEEVVYLYKPSREGGFLREYLNGFGGVLVSDFYTAYDSLPYAQQKCLIHLIRDLNNDILANPFDGELKDLAGELGQLLRAAVTTIDRHGLNRRHLGKHKAHVERYFDRILARTCRSDVVQAYQQRFEKYRAKLFTFLDHDGVTWNNNNAEHAIKAFAYYREIADGLMTESGLTSYLTLLSIQQTCVYKGVSFLKFLVSQERDLDVFCAEGRRGGETVPYDLYPEGYIPPQLRSARSSSRSRLQNSGSETVHS
jgi:predicted RecB family nuclease